MHLKYIPVSLFAVISLVFFSIAKGEPLALFFGWSLLMALPFCLGTWYQKELGNDRN